MTSPLTMSSPASIDRPTVHWQESEVPLGVEASDSHALACDNHEEKGAVQEAESFREDAMVRDLGWNRETSRQLIGGLDNEELWMLIRRCRLFFDVLLRLTMNGQVQQGNCQLLSQSFSLKVFL